MRRGLVGAVGVAEAVAGVAAGEVGSLIAQDRTTAQVDLSRARLVDMSHAFNGRTIYWPTATRFKLTEIADGETEGGWHYAANDFTAAEHGGTHLDAPVPFAPQTGSASGRARVEVSVGA